MTVRLAEAQAWLVAKRLEQDGVTITYKRGSDSVTLIALHGRSSREVAIDYGLLIEYQSTDYLVRPTDLVLGGEQVTPEPGDVIEEEDAGKRYVFEVTDLEGAPCYTIDAARSTMRVHVKLLRTEDV